MARTMNEIAVEWLESKDNGLVHQVNVKHFLGDPSNTVEGTEVIVKLRSRHYRAKVID